MNDLEAARDFFVIYLDGKSNDGYYNPRTGCFEVTRSFELKCQQVCTDEEYSQLKKAFFEKEQNLMALQKNIRGEDNR